MSARRSVSVVVSVYRNRDTVAELHARLAAVGEKQGWDLQQVFVDDACPEGSGAVLSEIAAGDPNTTVVALRENLGQQGALWIGASYSREENVAFMDADLQDRPEDLPLLLNRLTAGAELAVAVRSLPYQGAGRTLASRAFKELLSRVSPLPPGYGMFLAVRRSVLVRAFTEDRRGLYLPLLFAEAARTMATVPIERAPRPLGSSAYRAGSRMRFAATAVRTLTVLCVGTSGFRRPVPWTHPIAWTRNTDIPSTRPDHGAST